LSNEHSDTVAQLVAFKTDYDLTVDHITTTMTGITTDLDAFTTTFTQSVGEISSTVTAISGDLMALSGQY